MTLRVESVELREKASGSKMNADTFARSAHTKSETPISAMRLIKFNILGAWLEAPAQHSVLSELSP